MTFEDWRHGEVAVVGLGRSGTAVTRLLRAQGARVYASDASATALDDTALAALRAAGAEVELGRHDLDRIRRASLVVVSPGVPSDAPPLRTAREAGVMVRSELAIALSVLEGVPYVAVTGTNGKSTVTHIVGHLLSALGHDVAVAGNIGQALSEVALRPPRPAWIALEVSSYQLRDTPDIAPTVGVLTNLAPDHLDRYETVEAYYADKRRLFDNATAASRWVVNADDAQAMVMVADVAGHTYRFSAEGRLADAFYDRPHGALILLDEPLMRRSDLPLHGDHNVANALAAALAVSAASPAHGSLQARKQLAGALRTVRPLPHRLETVGEIDGVLWIDDSKATNVASARVGIAAMSRPTILLLG
ncbi:MAG TPA: UDP-N-acetylmuramoyl-L-alanine--D-glutamate ligase, partial [Gemmatimonadaceae bacterium]